MERSESKVAVGSVERSSSVKVPVSLSFLAVRVVGDGDWVDWVVWEVEEACCATFSL